jgi:hypothetical protein
MRIPVRSGGNRKRKTGDDLTLALSCEERVRDACDASLQKNLFYIS